MHYYTHNIGDFDAATRHCSRLERSIFRDLIDLYYHSETPLDLDEMALSRRIMATSEDERAALKAVLFEFFLKSESGWRSEKIDQDIGKYHANKKQKKEAGRASASVRWGAKVTPVTDPLQHSHDSATDPLQRECNALVKHKPITINHKPITIEEPREPAALVADAPKLTESKQKRKCQLPEDWKPNENHSRIAAEHSKNLQREAEMFRDHFLGKGVPMANWDLTFNNWLRRVPFGGRANTVEKKVSFTKEDHANSQPLF